MDSGGSAFVRPAAGVAPPTRHEHASIAPGRPRPSPTRSPPPSASPMRPPTAPTHEARSPESHPCDHSPDARDSGASQTTAPSRYSSAADLPCRSTRTNHASNSDSLSRSDPLPLSACPPNSDAAASLPISRPTSCESPNPMCLPNPKCGPPDAATQMSQQSQARTWRSLSIPSRPYPSTGGVPSGAPFFLDTLEAFPDGR